MRISLNETEVQGAFGLSYHTVDSFERPLLNDAIDLQVVSDNGASKFATVIRLSLEQQMELRNMLTQRFAVGPTTQNNYNENQQVFFEENRQENLNPKSNKY